MNKLPRILFVCYADSPHSQGWVKLLKDAPFETRIFTTRLRLGESVAAPTWVFPTYITLQPARHLRFQAQIFWMLPSILGISSLYSWLEERFSLSTHYLNWVIRSWKPDIVHSMPTDTAGKLARRALEQFPPNERPKWIVSSYGSDVALGLDDPNKSENLKAILDGCDGFMADCRRDRRLAVSGGLDPSKLALKDSVPGQGGLDLDFFARLRKADRSRNLILVPKAFERDHANRALVILEAFRLLGEAVLQDFEIHLLMCSRLVASYLLQMPEWLKKCCHCHGVLPQEEVFELLFRARVVLAPSLSDGTPNVMLEAMAAGALPVMSPIESHQEWITDGKNGLLAHALYPDQIAAALQRALTDNALFERASNLNWEIVRLRANRHELRENVQVYYRSLIAHP